jgi:CBS domain-containing protein
MPKAFDFTSAPFDRLRPAEMERVEAAVDIVFLRTGATVLRAGALPDHLYLIIKGLVEERDGEAVADLHGPGDAFDPAILLHHACRHDFVVREEAITWRLPIEDFLELTANNQAFAAFYLQDISHKLEELSRRSLSPQGLGSLTARVSETSPLPPVYVPPMTTLHEAALQMDEAEQRALLIEEGGRTGIVTGVDLTRAAVRDRRPLETPVREVAHFDLVAVEEESFLFEAALLMARYRVRHLVVRRGGSITGVLDAANVLSSLANQAAPIAALIDRAQALPQVAEAGERIMLLIRQLHASGTKTGFLADLSAELHRRMTEKVFHLLAPADLAEHACLIVMGSEGRGEYMLQTDQDNGLILEDGYTFPDLEGFTRRLTEALVAVGFPPCPGNIMASNPKWAKPLSAWRESVRDWVMRPNEQALMDTAIFYDAAPVAGRADLVTLAKPFLFELTAGNQAFHARFAQATLMFDGSSGFLGGLLTRGEERLDIKKAGIFPLVHGTRALALERQLTETGTIARLRRLAEHGLFDKAHAQQLVDAFTFLLGLRLATRLERMRLHQTPDNLVDTAALTKLERDLLKGSLQIARRFKDLIRHHFRLGLL